MFIGEVIAFPSPLIAPTSPLNAFRSHIIPFSSPLIAFSSPRNTFRSHINASTSPITILTAPPITSTSPLNALTASLNPFRSPIIAFRGAIKPFPSPSKLSGVAGKGAVVNNLNNFFERTGVQRPYCIMKTNQISRPGLVAWIIPSPDGVGRNDRER